MPELFRQLSIETSRSSNEAYVPEILIQDKCLQYKPSQYKDIESNEASPRSCDHVHSLEVHQHYYNIDGCSTGNPGQVQRHTCINKNIHMSDIGQTLSLVTRLIH